MPSDEYFEALSVEREDDSSFFDLSLHQKCSLFEEFALKLQDQFSLAVESIEDILLDYSDNPSKFHLSIPESSVHLLTYELLSVLPTPVEITPWDFYDSVAHVVESNVSSTTYSIIDSLSSFYVEAGKS